MLNQTNICFIDTSGTESNVSHPVEDIGNDICKLNTVGLGLDFCLHKDV